MESSRSRLPKVLLWLAVLLMAIAQCLPWENVPLLRRAFVWSSDSPPWIGSSITKQIDHDWTFTVSPSLPPRTYLTVYPRLIESEVRSPQPPTEEMHAYQIQDLWRYGRVLLGSPPSLPQLISSPWPAILFIIWPVAFIALLAMPFLTGPLGHSRAVLWLVRVLAGTMLVWLIRNLLLAFHEQTFPEYDRIGSGYWLTLAALVVEIIGLFLISNPRTDSFRKTGAAP